MQKKIRIPLANTVFKLGLLLLVVKTIASSSRFFPYNDILDDGISVVASLLLMFSILTKKFSLRVLIVYALVALLALYTSMQVNSLFVFLVVIVCLALRGENLEESIRFVFFYETVLLVLHVILALIMMALGQEMYLSSGDNIRYHFGLNHPNLFSIIFAAVSR